MKEEIKRILKMVEEGKIDTDKASELIEAMDSQAETQRLPKPATGDKMLRIKVISEKSDNVNVNVPVSFLKSIGTAVNSIKIPGVSEQDGINVRMIMDAIDSGLEGKILDVKTGSGDLVEITIE